VVTATRTFTINAPMADLSVAGERVTGTANTWDVTVTNGGPGETTLEVDIRCPGGRMLVDTSSAGTILRRQLRNAYSGSLWLPVRRQVAERHAKKV
jgi:hypothetical protein